MVLEVARSHGLHVRIEATDDTGWDFRVRHSVDESGARWILREPRRPEVAELIPVEARLLDVLKLRLPVAIPNWVIRSPELVAYRTLDGTPLAEEDPATLAYQWRSDPSAEYFRLLGATVAELHRVPVAAIEHTGVEIRAPQALRAEVETDLLAGQRELGIPDELVARWRRWLEEDGYWPGEYRLTHGDLSPNHTLVDESGALVGLLDWTDAAVNDPAVDFAAPFLAFGAAGLDRLLRDYAHAGGHSPDLLREHVMELTAFRFSVQFGLYGLRTGNDHYVNLARSRLAG